MKNKFKIIVATLFILTLSIGIISCSKDTGPSEVDFFVGTYNGKISYTNIGEESINIESGRITVVKMNSTYNFDFSNSIPSITGVKFEKKGDNTYISIGTGLTGITVTKDKLTMLVIRDKETWTADCSR